MLNLDYIFSCPGVKFSYCTHFKEYITIIILSIFMKVFALFALLKCDYLQLQSHVNMFNQNKILAKEL